MNATAAGIAWLVAFVLLTVVVTGVARRVGWSAPIVLVAVGVGAAFVPGVPEVRLDPELVLAGLLPALLFAAALQTSFLEVRSRGDSILTLSVGLVVFSAAAVGIVTWAVVPGLSIAAAVAFGAIVAPTDAVSVGAVAGTGRLPRRLATLLESEGLLNDATALVLLNTALESAQSPLRLSSLLTHAVLAVVGGAASGALAAVLLGSVRSRLKAPVLDTSLSLVTPYVAYLPAVAIGGSGFLAVAVTGLWLGYRSPSVQSAEARVAERINWRTVSFLLENAVFLLIGLQLPAIVRAAAATGIGLIPGVFMGAAIYAAMVAARFVWVFGATTLYRYGPARLRDRRWSWRTALAISYAGVRGVVTLAGVFLLPPTGPVGFLQLVAFVVVVLSLLQGLGLTALVRWLRLPLPNRDQDRMQVRTLLAEAQSSALERLDAETTAEDSPLLVSSLRQSAEYRVALGTSEERGEAAMPDSYARLRLLMLQSEREAVLTARQNGRYEEVVVDTVLADLDSIETAMKRSVRRDLPARPVATLHLPRLLPARPRRDPGEVAPRDER